jgi:hypothetical protein
MTETGYEQAQSVYDQLERLRSEEAQAAREVIVPTMELAGRVEKLLAIGPLPRNEEVRSKTPLPPGVVLAADYRAMSDDDAAEVTRVIGPADEKSFRDMGTEADVDRAEDITLADSGLDPDSLETCEGGLFHTKGLAQQGFVLAKVPLRQPGQDGEIETDATGEIAQCASRNRPLTEGGDELVAVVKAAESIAANDPERKKARLLENLSVDLASPKTEWDGLVILWVAHPEFAPSEQQRHLAEWT